MSAYTQLKKKGDDDDFDEDETSKIFETRVKACDFKICSVKYLF